MSRNACLAILALAAGLASAVSAEARTMRTSALRVPLACSVQQQKVIVITNTTGATLAAGTLITFDAVRLPDGHHYAETNASPLLPPGAYLQVGGWPSTSCTAWYTRRPLLLQSN